MKRILALVLAIMLMSCAAALAEDAGEKATVEEASPNFDITMVVPEGYNMDEYRNESTVFLVIDSEAENTPNFIITVAYDEEYDGVTLNELGDEEKKELLAVMDDDFMQAEVHDLITEHGTEVFILNEVYPDVESHYAAGFSIYKGYFVQIFAIKPNYEQLSQEDLDLAVKILSDMWFIERQ